jgi:RNA polymerase sigma-70 factor, ECF subfamily
VRCQACAGRKVNGTIVEPRGELGAFNEQVVKYERIAYNVAYRILRSSHTASDAVQEGFIKAFRALPSFKNGSFRSWLMRIVVNTCYESIRLNRCIPTESISDELHYDDDGGVAYQVAESRKSRLALMERMEFRERIELGIRALPVEQRSVLVLSDLYGYSYQEISEITGMAMGTVKSRISRARLKVRDFLLQQPELLPVGLQN